MSTVEAERHGWAVRNDEPIRSSDRTRVYDIPYGNLFEIEVMDAEGVSRSFETRAYTKSLTIEDSGHVSIQIGAKSKDVPTPMIPYPYHYLHNGTLFALKLHKHNVSNQFALNYDLFSLDFELIVVMHFEDDQDKEGKLFISTKKEWEDNGELGQSRREVQMFLGVEESRSLLVKDARALMSGQEVSDWISKCQRIREYKA